MAKKVVNFRYDEDDWDLVHDYARAIGTTATKVISEYLDSLIGKDNSKDKSFTDESKDNVKIDSQDIEDCKDAIESFKTQFTNNQNEILSKVQDRISELENINNCLSKKVDKLLSESTNKGNLIKGLNDKINYIRNEVENTKLSTLSLIELKELAKGNKVKFNSRIAKQDLVKLLIDNKVIY